MKTTSCRIPRPLGLLLLLPSLASADFYQAPFGPGGTWNVYETVSTGATFKNALADAKSRNYNGTAGTLVSITSADENTMVGKVIRGQMDSWIGLTDREGAAPGAFESQTVPATNQTTGWAWTSGEPFVYSNWGGGEPNDAGGEDAGQLRGDGMWNDNASGFGLNDPIAPVTGPAGSSNAEGTASFGYVVEYFTGSATPLAGVRMGSIFSPSTPISAPAGGVGTWGVREVRGLPGAANVLDAANKLASGGGTSTTAQLARLNVSDPDTNGQGGPILPGPTTPFLSNTAGDDNDILTVANGRIKVTEAGTYTLQVRSDDGFALQVKGQQFDSVNGSGFIDPVDRSTIAFQSGTGDANTRGVITLAAGEYDVQFVHFEGGGGANYEVTSTKGAVSDPNTAQWLALGDGSTQNARARDIVKMTTAATVTNASNTTGNNLAAAKATVNAAIAGGTAVSKVFTTLNIPEGDMPIAPTKTDDYSTKVTGGIALENGNTTPGESITITFHLASDDGSSLRIIGQDFTAINDFSGDGNAALVDEAGDTIMSADYPTGNVNAFGAITLLEGQNYNFEVYHSEGGGGSSLAIYYAIGDYTATGWDPAAFRLLTADDLGTFAANTGMALVPEPSTTGLFGLAAFGLLGVRRRRAAH